MDNDFTTSRDSYGSLLTPDIKLHRRWFKEMARQYGYTVVYKAPIVDDKHYNLMGEYETKFQPPIQVRCIVEEHPTARTTKKLGWNAEQLQDGIIIHVPYDLQDLQVGALFVVPSPFDNSKGRVFRVQELSSIMIYPASIACLLIPEYESTHDKSLDDYSKSNFNLIVEEDEDDL